MNKEEQSVAQPKVILDLCGGTGSWSKPYATRGGYLVHNITLPYYDLFDIELKDSEIRVKSKSGDREDLCIPASNVYGILAAPTCTMFSLARTTARTPRDLAAGMKLVKRCLEVIWYCREQPDSSLKFWALENPLGLLRQFLGRPVFSFSPEQFGENYTKKTDLWGYFNTPKGKPYKLNEDETLRSIRNNRVLPELPEGYVLPDGWNRQAARRSMTSSKFAEAFFRANK